MREYAAYVALIVATRTEEAAVRQMYDWEPVGFPGGSGRMTSGKRRAVCRRMTK